MRARKPKEVCPVDEAFPWEWVEFIKVGNSYIPVSLYELYGDVVRWWMSTKWGKHYAKETIRRLKLGTPFVGRG